MKTFGETLIHAEFECVPLNKEGYDFGDGPFDEQFTINQMKKFGIEAEKVREVNGNDIIRAWGKFKNIKKWYNKHYKEDVEFLVYILK